MKAFKKFLSCNQFIIGALFILVIGYALYGVIDAKQKTLANIETVTAKSDSFDVKFQSMLPEIHRLYSINPEHPDTLILGKDTLWKWYPPEAVNKIMP